ncbi:protein STICHEL-like isoform X1 [Typha latifolia]|uniref:protein STICHEL-like isoform X1 n=1 Tax=Typha latifolia TaxID=4733 RepID=UPI003C2E64C1
MLSNMQFSAGQLMAYVAFQNHEAKFRAKKSLSSLTDLIEEVLRQNVDFRIGLLSEISLEAPKSVSESTFRQYNESTKFSGDLGKLESSSMIASSEKNLFSKFHKLPRKNIDYLEGKAQRTLDRYHSSTLQDQVFQESSLPTHRNKNDTRQRRQGTAVNKTCTETVQEPRLDAAWLQTVDTGGFRSDTHPKPQRNHVLPHYSITCQNKTASSVLPCIPSRHWEEEPSNTIEINLKESQGKNKKKTAVLPDQFSHPISINLLHHNASTSNFLQKLGNTTEPGHTRILSWKSSKLIQGKVRQGNQLKSQNDGSILCFGCCWKSKAKDSRYTR